MLLPIILTLTCTPTPNSTGLPATLEHVGGANFVCGQLPPGQFAGIVSSYAPTSLPFGDGTLCVSPMWGWFRTEPRLADANGEVTYGLAGHPGLVPGTTRYFQVWYRDPGHGSFGFNLSASVTLEVGP